MAALPLSTTNFPLSSDSYFMLQPAQASSFPESHSDINIPQETGESIKPADFVFYFHVKCQMVSVNIITSVTTHF